MSIKIQRQRKKIPSDLLAWLEERGVNETDRRYWQELILVLDRPALEMIWSYLSENPDDLPELTNNVRYKIRSLRGY